MTSKAVSWALAMMLLFLIALSGGFIVRFALGSLLENEIQKTLGVRLLLHSISLMRSSFNFFPQGAITVSFSGPSNECKLTCLDCYESTTLFGSVAVCDCNNYQLANYSPITTNYCCKGVRYTIDELPSFCNPEAECPSFIDDGVTHCGSSFNSKVPSGGCFCGNSFVQPETNNYCCEGVRYTDENVPSYCDINNESPTRFNQNLGVAGGLECVSSTKSVIPEPGCYCGDPGKPLAERQQLLDVPANQYGLVCDDFRVVGLESVIIARNVEPAATGVKADLQAHPESSSFWGDYGRGLVTVYTENPLDLYDYLNVRESLISDKEYTDVFHINEDLITMYKKTEWNYDTLTKGTTVSQGLKGLLDKIFYHCSNNTIEEGRESDYCLVSGFGGSLKGVRCPNRGGVEYSLVIPAGYKINQTGNLVCEYKCVNQDTFETSCEDGWLLNSCFNISDLTKSCPSCGCDNFNFTLELCSEGECVGGVNPDKDEFEYVDIYTGNVVSQEAIDLVIFCTPPLGEGVCGSTATWDLSRDCTITAECLEDGDIELSVGGDTQCTDFINCDCDSKNLVKTFSRDSVTAQTITIRDHPRRSPLQIRLTDDLVEAEYEVLITGSNDDAPATGWQRCPMTHVRLVPFEGDFPRSLMITALKSELNDSPFTLRINNDSPFDNVSPVYITVEEKLFEQEEPEPGEAPEIGFPGGST
ncbi:hypothetical protein GF352_04830 [archaeon]|nr:hypothetical protein [archaeon]